MKKQLGLQHSTCAVEIPILKAYYKRGLIKLLVFKMLSQLFIMNESFHRVRVVVSSDIAITIQILITKSAETEQ